MGYYTRFTLSFDSKLTYPQCDHAVVTGAQFCHVCGRSVRAVPVSELIYAAIKDSENLKFALGDNGGNGESCKWYEWKEDMIKLSKQFPEVCFKLHGEGEENGDIWDAYFLKGKSQVKKAKIILDECDPKGWQ